MCQSGAAASHLGITTTNGALAYRTDLSPEEVHRTATTIEENSRLALTELREVLGVLREGPGDADPELPQVGPGEITALVEESRAAGMRVEFSCSADLAVLSDRKSVV